MTESTDPELAGQCAHCGKFFPLRRYVNQYGGKREGKPVPAKHCSPACRQAYYRARIRNKTPAVDVQGMVGSPVTDPQGAYSTSSSVTHPKWKPDAFERLQGDAILSKWKPIGDGKDVPDISDFLRR